MTRTRMSQKMDMDSIKAKLARERENPEEAAKMDADIRESKRSVGARALVENDKSPIRMFIQGVVD